MMYDKIKRWYAQGFWTMEMVAAAVVKGKLTAAEYQTITGQEYPA